MTSGFYITRDSMHIYIYVYNRQKIDTPPSNMMYIAGRTTQPCKLPFFN